MPNFNWCWLYVGKVGCFGWVFFVCFYNTIFTKADLKTQIILLPRKQNLEKYFNRQHILHKYFASSLLKINLCTSRRTQLQQSLETRGSFVILRWFFFVCIDILRRCQHFFSHVATFPCPSRLNQYLEEDMTLLSSIIEPSPNSNPLNTCLTHWYKATVDLDCSKLILYVPVKSVMSGHILGCTSTK